MTELPRFQPGDFFVLRSGGFVSRAIRAITQSSVNHAGIVTTAAGDTVESEAAGAVQKRVRPGMIFSSDLPLTAEQRPGVVAAADKLRGTPYSYLGVAALGAKQFGISIKPVDKYLARNDDLFCSQLVDYTYFLAGVHLFNDDRAFHDVTPGDLERLISDRPWRGNPQWGKGTTAA
jgi:hypothetical protein